MPWELKVPCVRPVHHNPTGYTMSNEKRVKLMQLAKKHNFLVVADEAYQLLNFEKSEVFQLNLV